MSYPFVQARNISPGPRRGPIELLVVHDMESDETIRTAENCASYFANQPPAYRDERGNLIGSSAHACGDSDSIVECVRDDDIAWAAPGANHNGLHFEHAGRARQTRDEWLDDFGVAMLQLSARWFAEKALAYGIPVVWLEAEDLAPGARGITTHRATTFAYGIVGGHTDPGGDFPVDVFMQFVRDAAAARPGPEEDDVNVEVRYGFEPSWGRTIGSPILGRLPEVEVDAREGAIRGYNGVAFEPRDLMDGDPRAGGQTAVDVSGGRLDAGPVRYTRRDGDTVVFVTQGGGRYVITAVAP